MRLCAFRLLLLSLLVIAYGLPFKARSVEQNKQQESIHWASHSSSSLQTPVLYRQFSQRLSQSQIPLSNKAIHCQAISVYKDELVFPSRYQGSQSARDQVNALADKQYQQKSQAFIRLQKYVVKQVDRFLQKREIKRLHCVLSVLETWQQQSSILTHTENHTGKAVRKWTLAAISSALLKVQSQLHARYPQRFQAILDWLQAYALQVVDDYSHRPLAKVNNHDYWAAWSVMATAVLVQSPILFDWSQQVLERALGQIDPQGYLANEMKRGSRALLYHNYALTPLLGLAMFSEVNQSPLTSQQKQQLRLLIENVVDGVLEPDIYHTLSGVKQVDYDFYAHGRLSWVYFYPFVFSSPLPRHTEYLDRVDARYSTRLGGLLTL